uniref:acetate--CoA ligase family protein n=1 Tax=Pseudomonas antarctica TaxID=219572 RepID=UPI001A91EB6D
TALPEWRPRQGREHLHAKDVAALQGEEDALAAWGRIADYQNNRRVLLERGESVLEPFCPKILGGQALALDEWASKQALRAFGLSTPAAVLSTPGRAIADAKRLGYPLVLKAVSADLPHKTEAGAVALNLQDGFALTAALEHMRRNIAEHAPGVLFEQLLLESMAAPPLAELIVGIKRENDFGLALVIGAGGILVELLKDSRSLLLPTTDAAIRNAVLSLRSVALLQGFRGREVADMDALVAAIRAVADYACAHAEQLLELDVNPLLVNARGVTAVDALIRLGDGYAG